jgi:hypothetical protein
MQIDTSKWSGEGEFTQVLVDQLQALDGVTFVRVEDAPASRTEADYNFISNEIFVEFALEHHREPVRRLGILPGTKAVTRKAMTIADLEKRLTALDAVGPPDYSDEGMMQFLKSERIVPPYQTRGYKLVELVRIYEVGTASRS